MMGSVEAVCSSASLSLFRKTLKRNCSRDLIPTNRLNNYLHYYVTHCLFFCSVI